MRLLLALLPVLLAFAIEQPYDVAIKLSPGAKNRECWLEYNLPATWNIIDVSALDPNDPNSPVPVDLAPYRQLGAWRFWAQCANYAGPSGLSNEVVRGCGDVNVDGRVDISDVLIYRRVFTGYFWDHPYTPEQEAIWRDWCSVVGDDESCDSSDVVVMLRYMMGLPPGLGTGCRGAH